jgi:hypothetical protein
MKKLREPQQGVRRDRYPRGEKNRLQTQGITRTTRLSSDFLEKKVTSHNLLDPGKKPKLG